MLLLPSLRGGVLITLIIASAQVTILADDSDRTTHFYMSYNVDITPGSCIWDREVIPWTPQNVSDTTATYSCGAGDVWSVSYAAAGGIQVWGYSASVDWCAGGNGIDSAIAASSSGSFKIFRKPPSPYECSPLVKVTWQIKLEGEADLGSGDAESMAAARMYGRTEGLAENDFEIEINKSLRVKSSPGLEWKLGSEGWEVSATEGEGYLPLVFSEEHIDQGEKDNTSVTALVESNVRVGTWADATIVGGPAGAEAFIWNSDVHLQMNGECESPCSGSIQLDYGEPFGQ